jgi:mannose-1-phosphate guanylyltransferase
MAAFFIKFKINTYKGGRFMKALFLAGGMENRLKPLIDDLPKAMVPIMAKPLLERNMLKLKDLGVDEIIISTRYKPRKIQEYFGDGTKLGLKIHYLCEDIPLGTGGAIKNAEEFFQDTFIILNADILCNINISDMIKFHKEKHASVTIAVTLSEDPSAYGVVEFDENLNVQSFAEKPELSDIKSKYINAGIYIFEPDVLKEIPDLKLVSLEKEIYPLLLEKGYPISAYKSDGYWIDIDTVEKYEKAHQDILNGTNTLKEYKYEEQNIFIGENTIINPFAKIIGPVYIGENTKIDAYSTIGPNTVIGNYCKIGTNNIITDSIVWNKMNIQNNSTFVGIILNAKSMIIKSNIVTSNAETEISDKKIAL